MECKFVVTISGNGPIFSDLRQQTTETYTICLLCCL